MAETLKKAFARRIWEALSSGQGNWMDFANLGVRNRLHREAGQLLNEMGKGIADMTMTEFQEWLWEEDKG